MRAVKRIPAHDTQGAQAVLDAAPEIHRGSLCEIAGRDGNFADTEAERHGLRDHLGVEDEVVGVEQEGDGLEQPPAVRPEAAVHFGEMLAQAP